MIVFIILRLLIFKGCVLLTKYFISGTKTRAVKEEINIMVMQKSHVKPRNKEYFQIKPKQFYLSNPGLCSLPADF